MNYIWRAKRFQYQSGEYLYLNRIYVGEYSWNSYRPQGSEEANHYEGNIFLPSIKNKRVFADTAEEVKVKVEKIVNSWLIEATKIEGGKDV
ncbi:hypothetical protein LCGC14_2040070 [marine sediment metagenome]|uniref:Uncharacterized protein n=1 Tax=marine sediment metagenome TaxID=412755 RepID=A0A0F9ES21_9ZZZZ